MTWFGPLCLFFAKISIYAFHPLLKLLSRGQYSPAYETNDMIKKAKALSKTFLLSKKSERMKHEATQI